MILIQPDVSISSSLIGLRDNALCKFFLFKFLNLHWRCDWGAHRMFEAIASLNSYHLCGLAQICVY